MIALTLGLTTSIGISRQIKKIVNVTYALSENDLSKTVDIDNKSELESLGKALNTSITTLKTLIVEISEGAAENSASTTNKLYLENQEIILKAIAEGMVVSEIKIIAAEIENIASQTNLIKINLLIDPFFI
ncbi:HAMP domain-containing protein [Clostridium sp.]|uniref:HAMP domain-containing protein n=1 Tax=Clostridium sp. TaxID=1506 RepID=UPI001A61C1D8|nr:HAMP domain-containing protein [Clostridium sp.]MBK5236790.1 HAMP domain-containing protein [Clostridium sp.]